MLLNRAFPGEHRKVFEATVMKVEDGKVFRPGDRNGATVFSVSGVLLP